MSGELSTIIPFTCSRTACSKAASTSSARLIGRECSVMPGIVFQVDANDWNHVGSFHRGPNRIRTAGKNDVAVEGDQLAGKFVVTFEGAAGIADLQHSVLAIEIPGFA